MALEKTDISIDLVSGADTKVNTQIDTSFQEMINVSFDGDMTAKKMKGYDSIQALPSNQRYSLLARRQGDLLAATNKGVYKYIKDFNQLKKISPIIACEIDSNESPGAVFAFSENYRCFSSYKSFNNGLSELIKEEILFYTHEGVLVNSITFGAGEAYTVKIIAKDDSFFVIQRARGVGTALPGSNIELAVYKYSLNFTTNEFFRSDDSNAILTGNPDIEGLDAFADQNYIFLAYKNATQRRLLRLNIGSLVTFIDVAMSNTPIGLLELTDKNANEFYLACDEDMGPGPFPPRLRDFKIFRYSKSTLALLGSSSPTIIWSGGVDGNGTPVETQTTSYVVSDNSAVVFKTYHTSSTQTVFPPYAPKGKIFKVGEDYFIPVIQSTTNNVATIVLKFIKTPSIIPGDFVYGMSLVGISDTGQVNGPMAGIIKILNDSYEYQGKRFFTSSNPAKRSVLVSVDQNTRQTDSYLEINKTCILSGGLTSYFDGESFQEYGFIGNPYMTNFVTTDTGAFLPADTGYAVACIYSYVDAQGNIFYSPPSTPYGGFDPVNGITIAANGRIKFIVHTPVATHKKIISLEIYIRRKNKLFQLSKKIDITADLGPAVPGDLAILQGSFFAIDITSYPGPDAKIMPYQDGSIAPESLSNSKFIALYSDRVFRISKDNPNSLAYSQRKLADNGFEFNDSFFYLDVLDKRGVAEDSLTGCIAMDGRLIIFKEGSVLYIAGSGPSRANTQDDFSEPQLIASDVGCTEPRSIVLTPEGVMFKSDKGIYLIDRSLQPGYIGSNVEQFNSNTITSAILLENYNEVRFSTLEGVTLVYNYLSRAWSWFINMEVESACLFKGKYTVLRNDGFIITETSSHNKMLSQEIVQTIASPWLRLNKIQGYQKAYYVRILGKYKTAHRLKMKVFYDYELYPSEEYLIDPLAANQYNIEIKPTNEAMEKGTATNGVYQMKIDLVRKNCQAVRVVIEDVPLNASLNTGECFALSNITVNIGLKKGLAKIQASKSY